MTASLLIFLFTYTFIAFRNVPGFPLDMPAGTLVGAVLTVAAGVLSLQEAYIAIDWNTILLLLGMMLVVAYLAMAGFFGWIASLWLRVSPSPLRLLIGVVLLSGVLSALFVNDTICLFFTPILLVLLRSLRLNPVPYLIALATASNIGGQMSIMGNPQNMFIGNHSEISFGRFLLFLAPITLIGLFLNIGVIAWIYRKEFFEKSLMTPAPIEPVGPGLDRTLMIKGLGVVAAMLVLFLLEQPYPLVAIGGAAVLFLIGNRKPELAFRRVDWTLLVFFASLFVVMRGVERAGWVRLVLEKSGPWMMGGPAQVVTVLSGVTLVLSNLVSNVPAVVLLEPFVKSMPNPDLGWLTLAMSSTLAGNLTLVGSVANLIVVSLAHPEVEISFWEYLKVGAILTVLTIAVGIGILILEARFL
ncbi:MAG: anion transporter [Nitrospirae bacterium]|nr:anion transporter [Candidatus Manganitrophaceae bacterium]